jgi:hypothetical protein
MFDPDVYDKKFYTAEDLGRFSSASAVLTQFFKYYQPKSVVDFGCGLGHWLHVCEQLGAESIRGYDGHYVDTEALKIPQSAFTRHDFETQLVTDKHYDLAISIEVGEHLPEEKAAVFVKSITDAADVIVFSAAAPYQGGVNHFNERPPSYWAGLFKDCGYVCFDFLRTELWDHADVNCVHAQNILVFAAEDAKGIFESEGFAVEQVPQLKYHPEFVKIKLEQPAPKMKKKKRLKYYLLLPIQILILNKTQRKRFSEWSKSQ